MKTTNESIQIKKLLSNKLKYEALEDMAEEIFNRGIKDIGISKKCLIKFNQNYLLDDSTFKFEIERYLDFEILNDEISNDLALYYRICFAVAILFNMNNSVNENDN